MSCETLPASFRISRYSPGCSLALRSMPTGAIQTSTTFRSSYVERQNFTIRMSNRRFTRLTNGFAKRLENHKHMRAIQFFHYNFIRRHQSIKTTPAQMAGVADKAWTMVEFVEAMVVAELVSGGRLTNYKPSCSGSNPN